MLLSFQILTGIFHTYKRYTYGHFYLFIFFRIESKPCTDVVASQIPVILRVQLVFAIVFVPFGFHPRHLALEFPIPRLLRSLVYTHDKVDWKYCLRIIAERSQELHTLNFTVIYPAQISSRFIGQSFSQVHQNMTLPLWKSKAGKPCSQCRSSLYLNIILGQLQTVISR